MEKSKLSKSNSKFLLFKKNPHLLSMLLINLEQRKGERTLKEKKRNFDLEESTMAHTRKKMSKIASEFSSQVSFTTL